MIFAGAGLSHAASEFCFDIDALTLLEKSELEVVQKGRLGCESGSRV
jgi:hypothetical protein